MLTQQELKDTILAKISNLISVSVNDIDLTATFDQAGLDSLSLAVLFIELEQLSGFDPFGEGVNLLSDIRNIQDIISVYLNTQQLTQR